MKVTVTREHWDRGVTEAFPLMKAHLEGAIDYDTGHAYCEKCVLAQAFYDAGFKQVAVHQNRVVLDGRRYVLPREAQVFLRNFDRYETQHRTGRPQEDYREPSFPFEFEVTPE